MIFANSSDAFFGATKSSPVILRSIASSVEHLSSNGKRDFSSSPFESDNSASSLQNEGFQQQRDIRHEDYTFSNFIVGSSNEFAYKACMAVIDRPAVLYNPLFIHGASGLGKTHLMHSIGNFIIETDPSKRVLYVTSETFTNELIDSL